MEMNVFAIIIAAIVAMAVGGFWYSPAGFGKPWMKLVGMKMSDMKDMQKKDMGLMYFKGFLVQVVVATVLAWFIAKTGRPTIGAGLHIAFMAWLGFVATNSFGGVLWEKRPIALWLLNNAYNLVIFLVMGLILAWWM